MRIPIARLACLLLAGIASATPDRSPLHLAVMDPLAADLSCPCVEGHAQRDYLALVEFLEARLGQTIKLVFAEELGIAREQLGGRLDLVIGKHSVVAHDLDRLGIDGRAIAALTDKSGSTTLRGLFVARSGEALDGVADLAGKRLIFGPSHADEKHRAALEALQRAGIDLPRPVPTREGCNIAAVAVVEKAADAGVISDYALSLLEGCGNIEKDSLKVIGKTDPVPFITVWATPGIDAARETAIVNALRAVATQPGLCGTMETARGFVPVTWPGPRGPGHDGCSDHVPTRLPARPQFLWRRPTTNCAVGGIAATSRFVLFADKSKDGNRDVFRCLNAATGEPVWTLDYLAPGEMDYGNAPRATPVVSGPHAYLLGAFGHLHCVELETGEVIWKRRLAADFAAEVPTWGYCVPPILAGKALIINPGGKQASVVALDRLTGETLWQTPGGPAGYAAFTLVNNQVVGFDMKSVGGWDVATGKRLWKLVPEESGDFNVPAAVSIDDRLFLASENNGARMHAWEGDGRLRPIPLAHNDLMTPDTCTPVLLNGRIYAAGLGSLACLDARNGLKTIWRHAEDAFDSHASIIAGNDRVLVLTTYGDLILLDASADRFQPVSRLRPLGETETWSHPALTPGRLYLRSQDEIVCLVF